MVEDVSNGENQTEGCKIMKHDNCGVKSLIPAKASFLLDYMITGTFTPFVFLFLVSTGLTITQAGLINSIRFCLAAVISFLVGIVIDRTGKKRMTFFILTILNFTSLVSTPFVLFPFYKRNQLEITNNFPPNSALLNASVLNYGYDKRNSIHNSSSRYDSPLFYFTLFWFTLLAATGFPMLPILDSSIMNLVKSYRGVASYGGQRVFAPIGYTLGSLLSGFAVDLYTPSHGLNKYTIMFVIIIPMYFLFCICIYFLMKPEVEYVRIDSKENQSFLKSLYICCKNISFVVFLSTVLISGLSFNVINSYLLLLLEEYNISSTAMGLTVSLASFAEIIMFPISTKILHFLGGTYKCLGIAIFSYALRFFIYYMCSRLWHVLVAQLLHTFGFALFWAAAIEYTYEISPPNILQSVFSSVSAVYYMVSSVAANLFGSAVYDYIGGRSMFLSMSFLCGFWGVILVVFYIFVERHQANHIDCE